MYFIIAAILFLIATFVIGVIWENDTYATGDDIAWTVFLAAVACAFWFPVLIIAILVSPIFLGRWYARRKR